MGAEDMSGITFPSWADNAPVELLAILEVLGERGRRSAWQLHRLEVAPSDAAQRLHGHSERGERITGDELFRLAERKPQLIDGELEGWLPQAGAPWVLIRAVDSTSWDLVCDDDHVLDQARTRFQRATGLLE